MNYPIDGRAGDFFGGAQPVQVWLWPSERLTGDWLLSRWNGEEAESFGEVSFLVPMDYVRNLGALHLRLDLGMPLPRQAGTLWTYLIPASLPVAQWTNSAEPIVVRAKLPPNRAPKDYVPGPSNGVRLQRLTPGSYRLKLVWERHPPAGVWRTNIYVAQPGDYESVESQPVTVVKGQVATVTLACTNRVGGVEMYKEDEEWGRK